MKDQPRPEHREAGLDPKSEQQGKARQAYLDPGGSESTRDLRDTARRRRDAEEKLQQHLIEAKSHVPNEYRHHHDEHLAEQQSDAEQPGTEQPPSAEQPPGEEDLPGREERVERGGD